MKRGQLKSWEEQNPTLADGEIGFARDLNRIKIGDGQASWNELDYLKTNDVYIGDNAPEDEAIQLWIKPTKENEEVFEIAEEIKDLKISIEETNNYIKEIKKITNNFIEDLNAIVYGEENN